MFAKTRNIESSEIDNLSGQKKEYLERKIDDNFKRTKQLKLPNINRMSADNIVNGRNHIFRQSLLKYKDQLGESLNMSPVSKKAPMTKSPSKNIILNKKKRDNPNIFLNVKQDVSEIGKSKLKFESDPTKSFKKSSSKIGLKPIRENQLTKNLEKSELLNLDPLNFSRVDTSNAKQRSKLNISQTQKNLTNFVFNVAKNDQMLPNQYTSMKSLRRLKNDEFIQFQNMINNRERFQQKYEEYEIQAKYDGNNNLVYRGCLINGKKSSYGKEYYPETQVQKYEGVFSNDAYHGQGKLYDEDGTIQASGNFVNGEIEGFGQLYYPLGHLQYKGQIAKGGAYSGQGTYYYKNGKQMYVGDFSAGQRLGFGKEFSSDGMLLYEGTFDKNEYNGKGTLYHSNGHKYLKGTFTAGKMSGMGMEFNDKGCLYYAGNFEKNIPKGYGIVYDGHDNVIFKGNFVEGKKLGEGTLLRSTDASVIYQGNFSENDFNGVGKLFYKNGQVMYEGDFKNNLRNGKGTEYHQSGKTGYKGDYVNNNFHGKGIQHNLEGIKTYEGDLKNGHRNGSGTEFESGGHPIYLGQFKNGLYHGKGCTSFAVKDKDTQEIIGEYFNDFLGLFSKGVRVSGKMMYRNSQIFYEGKFKDEMPDGSDVTLYHENGNVLYKGVMKVGFKDGFGKTFYKDGAIKFIGIYQDNSMQHGALYDKNGKLQSRWVSQHRYEAAYKKISNRHVNNGNIVHENLNVSTDLNQSVIVKEKEEKKRLNSLYHMNDSVVGHVEFQGRLNLDVVRSSSVEHEKNISKIKRMSTIDTSIGEQLGFKIIPLHKNTGKNNKKKTIDHREANWYSEYFSNGALCYQGSKCKSGNYQFWGTLWYEKTCSKEYEGFWSNGVKNGSGIEFYPNNVVKTIGNFHKNKLEGKIIVQYNSSGKQIYNGGIVDDMKNW